MLKKTLAILLAILSLFLVSCSKPNDYGLSMAENQSERRIIGFEEDRMIYAVGGIMTMNQNGESKLLEFALNDGSITIGDIISVAEQDAADGDIEKIEQHDGSAEYKYDTFTLVVLNTTLGKRDVYFVPKNMGYLNVIN